jgi:hypothetical protein
VATTSDIITKGIDTATPPAINQETHLKRLVSDFTPVADIVAGIAAETVQPYGGTRQ